MSESKALRTSNTIYFPPTMCADTTMTSTERLSLIMIDLLAVLKVPPKSSLIFNSQQELDTTITTFQSILDRDNPTS